MSDIEKIRLGYLECALWTTNADHLDTEGTGAHGHLEDHFSVSDFTPEAVTKADMDIQAFLDSVSGDDISEYRYHWAESGHDPDEMIGHDLWLTRNGHGAGFWDRGLGEIGVRLTEAAKALGEQSAYAVADTVELS